ncbi:AAA family ATPase [Chloroflexota bacterium]
MTTEGNQEVPEQSSQSDKAPLNAKEFVGEHVAGVWVVSGEDMPVLSTIEESQGNYIISGGILGEKEKAITYAHPKHMKTMLEIWKAMCIATGTAFFDYPTKPGRVIYIGMEDSLPKLSNRVAKMKKHFPSIHESSFTVLPTGMRSIPAIESLIIKIKPKVIIVDPLANLLKREDKKEDVESLLKEFDRLIEQYGISIIIIHHSRKGKGETLESMRGSSALPGWADTICRIERRDQSKVKVKLDFESRHAVEEVDSLKLNFRREDCCFEEDTSLTSGLQKQIRQELIVAGGQMPLSELKLKLEDEASMRTIERAIKSMSDIQLEFDIVDRRKRIVKLDLAKALTTRPEQN